MLNVKFSASIIHGLRPTVSRQRDADIPRASLVFQNSGGSSIAIQSRNTQTLRRLHSSENTNKPFSATYYIIFLQAVL